MNYYERALELKDETIANRRHHEVRQQVMPQVNHAAASGLPQDSYS